MNKSKTPLLTSDAPQIVRHFFWINLGLIALFMVLFLAMVEFTESQSERASLQHWLTAEAEQYEQDFAKQGRLASLPNSNQFDIYWSDSSKGQNPQWLTAYQQVGFYEHHIGNEDKHLLVRANPSGQGLYYIVFKDTADDYLDSFENNLHLFASLLGLLGLAILFVYMKYALNKVAKPLQHVVEKINQMPPDFPDFKVDAEYQELRVIEQALLDSKQKMADFIRREQEFSRFSAHEIRTPLMVLQGSSQILQRFKNPDFRAQKALDRIEQSCDEIALLTDTFLLLGKQEIEVERFEEVNVNVVVNSQLNVVRELFPSENKPYSLHEEAQLLVQAPPAFVLVLIRNLLRNACGYSSGTVRITITESGLCIYNPYQSNSENLLQANRSYGYGLEIVERICQMLGWHFSYQRLQEEFCAQVVCEPKNPDLRLGCW